MKEKLRKNKIILKLLPIVLAIVIAAGFLVFKNSNPTNDDPILKEEENVTNLVKRKVYLLSNDNIVVPVTVSFEPKTSLADELYYVVSLLREDSDAVNKNFKGVINKDASITELIIQDGVITVGFSKEFLDYPVENELRIVESIVWTLVQYNDVNAVNINVDGKLLTKMPLGKTPLPKNITKDIGINNHIFPTLLNTKRVVTYYTKQIDGKEMFVPVSNNLKEDSISVFLELSTKRAPTLSGLKVSSYLKDTEILDVFVENNNIAFELTTSCLIEEDLVDYDVYHALQVALSSYKEDHTISINVEGETLAVDGLVEEEIITVNNVVYNEIVL